MSREVYLIIAVLAVWRITHMVWKERIFRSFRYLFGERLDKATGFFSYPDTWYGYLIDCFLCLSVHVSIWVTVVWYLCPILLVPFALSTLAIWMQEIKENVLH